MWKTIYLTNINKEIRIKICPLLISLKKEKEREHMVLGREWQHGLAVEF